MSYKVYFVNEAIELLAWDPDRFMKQYNSVYKTLTSRIKTFEKHGRGESKSAKHLGEALYDIANASTSDEMGKAYSRATVVLTSARGSYSKSRSIDRKIVQSLNEHFSEMDEEGNIKKPFIKMSELDEFGNAMEEAKDASLTSIYGSSQIAEAFRKITDENKGKVIDWKTLLTEYLGGTKK